MRLPWGGGHLRGERIAEYQKRVVEREFSADNVWRMRQFYAAHSTPEFLEQAVPELKRHAGQPSLEQPVQEIGGKVGRDTQCLRARSRAEGIVPGGNRGRSWGLSEATPPERVPPQKHSTPARGGRRFNRAHRLWHPCPGCWHRGGSAFRWCRCARPPAIFCDACGIRARQARRRYRHAGTSQTRPAGLLVAPHRFGAPTKPWRMPFSPFSFGFTTERLLGLIARRPVGAASVVSHVWRAAPGAPALPARRSGNRPPHDRPACVSTNLGMRFARHPDPG
jgi:hypothetical protein